MNRSRRGQGGQALIVMVIAILAIVAGMGLIIDGGNAWAQQRMTQAGNDASAEAGAVVLARMYAGEPDPGNWDSVVAAQVASTAAANSIEVPVAYYTDICGTMLKSDGTKATGPGDAAIVGAGVLPTNNHTNPDCPSGVVGPVAGVQAQGHKLFDSFVSRVIGIGQLNANTTATAVMGLLQGTCDSASGCVVLPVTAPVTVVTCAKNGDAIGTDVDWPMNTPVSVPLCKGNPGNVGWLDWDPPAGGVAELIQSILHPDNPPIDLPSWQYVTATGDVNSKGVEDAINSYIGQVVLFPMFDLTCGATPTFSQVKVAPNYGCSDIGGNGQNQWYRFPRFAGFLLSHAYINGNNKAQCDTGNGATSCLQGQFVHFVTSGTVGPGVGGGTDEGGVLGVQLIK